ncbi:bifunctional (p)ppGpp synthetase/guanosine-3',5'-bis(diphosphate) 3'-pyrophosphohydrolase [Candidatus Woesearchaeota archaeon]|nr:bifunctional (p)ppGpp synthetase/guanosine-3',5'-bis(diphosphate) 3'-pyrophosphohydrolase [Candidatus Woesearchaeota archaeon]
MSKTALVEKARVFAKQKHEGQFRKKFLKGAETPSDAPYFSHPSTVHEILLLVTKDEDLLSAAYLHDTLEDTGTTYSELRKEFGKRVADLVVEVSKDSRGEYPIKTREGLMLKLADTLHNVSTHGNAEYLSKKNEWLKSQISAGRTNVHGWKYGC